MSKSKELPGPSVSGDTIPESSLCSDKSKLLLKNAVVYYEGLLFENNLIASESSPIIPEDAISIGEVLYDTTLEILNEKQLIHDEELIHANEVCEEVSFDMVYDNSSPEEYEPEYKKSKPSDYISLDYKTKVVNIAEAHPSWSLATLQKKGCSRLKKREYLSKWKEDIKKGGTIFDKYAIIDSWTYDRFVEARQNYQQVTTRNLQQWALTAAAQFKDFDFKASERWVTNFKQKHGIRQRKITKYVSKKETLSIEEMLASAETFRIQTLRLIQNFNADFVINTDQTGMCNDL